MVATPPSERAGESPAGLRQRIASLSRRFDAARRRLPALPDEAAVIERMRRRIASQQLTLERLEHEAAAVLAEIDRLEDEVHGREKALALLLGSVLNRIDRATADAWSPAPILGYRLWAMRAGGLHGARVGWTTPEMAAVCEGFDGEVPHSDGTCGRLGCGIYATKSVGALLNLHVVPGSHSYVAGVVGLTGKVVEHERGYRGAAAKVDAVYAVWPDRTMATADAERIAALFAACDRVPATWCDLRLADLGPTDELVEYLKQRAEEAAAWI